MPSSGGRRQNERLRGALHPLPVTTGGYLSRPKIKAEEYGLPLACPKAECGFRWLKLPGLRIRPCPNCGSELVSTRIKKRRS